MAVTVSAKGWIVISAELRRKYALKAGSTVEIVDCGGVLALVPTLADPVKQPAGMLKSGRSLTQSLLAERRADRRREAAGAQ